CRMNPRGKSPVSATRTDRWRSDLPEKIQLRCFSRRRFSRKELLHQARFTREEALRVEALFHVEDRRVEVMTNLVQQRAKEGPEFDDLTFGDCAHPDFDLGDVAGFDRKSVEAVELAAFPARARLADSHADFGRAELFA